MFKKSSAKSQTVPTAATEEVKEATVASGLTIGNQNHIDSSPFQGNFRNDLNVQGSSHLGPRDSHDTNYHFNYPVAPAPPVPPKSVEHLTLQPYNAPEMPREILKELITDHVSSPSDFIRNAVYATYCICPRNQSIIYSSQSHDAYVFMNESVGVRYLHGDVLLREILGIIRIHVDTLYADGEIDERRARTIMDRIEQTADELIRHVAPVLHKASHDTLGPLRYTWRQRFPEYVRQLHRLEHQYRSTHVVYTMPAE